MTNWFLHNLKTNCGAWFKYLPICIVGIAFLSCSNDHESETGLNFETEFEKNYRAVAQQNKQNFIVELTQLKAINYDAYRGIAFTWQNAAVDACLLAPTHENKSRPLSSYQQLLNANRLQQTPSLQINDENRICIQMFYKKNWSRINAMIKLN